MIDIHSHILPGVDDGAKTLEEALAMAWLAVEGGTTIVFATPHVSNRQEIDLIEEIAGWVSSLQQALDKESIPLRLVPGAEVYPMDGIVEAIQAGRPLTLGPARRHILIDSPFSALPMGLGDLVYQLQTRGVTPILAHPERVQPVQENPQVLEELLHRGLLLQVNTSSILGTHGEAAQDTADILLEHRWVHFLASDAHTTRGRRPGQNDAAQELRAWLPEQDVADLVTNNGKRVLDGESVPTAPLSYTPPKRRGWFSWLRRR